MSQIQYCAVCKQSGIMVDKPIFVQPDEPVTVTMIAQCPRCRRWICNRHGELLYGSGFSGWIARWRKSKAVPLGCPFDCDVVLGSVEDD